VPAWHTNTVPGSEESPFSAEHGIAIGPAAGLVIKVGDTTVYHAGDTCLFSDMQLIARRSDIDVALLPIGGHYTMDRRDAVVAAEFVGAGTVIPMHHNTFPAIETDSQAFKNDVEAETSSTVVVLEPGQSHTTG
jgi:L-ascorbate metabolism protein UlaG (beta-lactamase superfamily)